MESSLEEGKISVWVCREEKLVSGLSRRTTCADVVKVLLEDQNLRQVLGASAAMLSGSPHSYCVVEKWRGFERTLPNKTRILRLWGAWGDEQENVRFVLVKTDASLPNNGPRSAEARVVQSKDSGVVGSCSPAAPGQGGAGGPGKGSAARACWSATSAAAAVSAAAGVTNLSQEKQKRVVRKAFRKLDKMNRKREEASLPSTAVSRDKLSSVEKMETLVHLVVSQDHTIRQQIQRIKELDREIERCEAKVHFDRIKRHGVNYVQDTYMVDSSSSAAADAQASSSSSPSSSDCKRKAERQAGATGEEHLSQFEEYARRCEEVVRLQEELTEREALVDSITGELQEELNQRWMKRRREDLSSSSAAGKDTDSLAESVDAAMSAAGGGPPPHGDEPPEAPSENELDEERIRTQLDTSLYIGLRLNTDLEAIRGDLDLSLALWEVKERELLDLLAKVETMEIEQQQQANSTLLPAEAKGGAVPGMVAAAAAAETESVSSVERNGGGGCWVEQARGLSKSCNTNDEDSDTGLSSMHSQDSDNPPVCESLV